MQRQVHAVQAPPRYAGELEDAGCAGARALSLVRGPGFEGAAEDRLDQFARAPLRRHALVNQPAVLFADEPTGNLDSAATTDVLQIFGQLRSAGQTLLIVTHDDRVAATANRVVHMRDGILAGRPGRADGPSAALTGVEG